MAVALIVFWSITKTVLILVEFCSRNRPVINDNKSHWNYDMVKNHILCFMSDVIVRLCSNFNGGLTSSLLDNWLWS